jgi:Bacterial archaeo-eukaryotic release factor family 3
LLEFLHRIVPPVEPLIKRSPAPVIVAAPPEVHGHFREIAGWREIQPDGITENPDALNEAERHRDAYALVEPKLAEAPRRSIISTHHSRRARRQLSARRSSKPRATRGSTLYFLTGDDGLWGWFDESEDRVVAHGSAADRDIDILDFVALMTLRQGGSVMLVAREALPPPGLSAAILRH